MRTEWSDAQRGRFEFHAQTGLALGVPDYAYVGEVSLGVVLHDPSGRLGELKRQASTYPPALADAIVDRLHEADFLIGGLLKAADRTDPVWVSGCLFRVVLLCVHALHARSGQWLVNEKGAVRSAARLAISPADFEPRTTAIMGRLGTTQAELVSTITAANGLVEDSRQCCQQGSTGS